MILEKWLAFPAGILISTVVSSVGIGGGVLWMPFLLLALEVRPDVAVVTSLLIQTAGKGSGSFAFYRQGRVDGKLAGFLLCVALPGIYLGASLSHRIRPPHIELILGLFLLTTAFLFVSSNEKYTDEGKPSANLKEACRHAWIAALMSVGSGMLSTGVGEWLIPVMRSRLSLRMSHAVATCIVVTFGACVAGAVIHLLMGSRPDWTVVLWGIPGVMAGGQIGPRINRRIDERLLKEIFIFVLTLIGIHLIYNSY